MMRNEEEHSAKILIVDDVPANLNLLRHDLESLGHHIVAVPSGVRALAIAGRVQPDVILLDVMMPEIDGIEVCRRLKASLSTAHIPVIFITARDEMEVLVKGYQAGGVDYITKPFEKEEVRARVSTHLRIHRLTQELIQKNQELLAETSRRQTAESERDRADEELSMISEAEAEKWGIDAFVGKSPTMQGILADVRQLQEIGTTAVLILGESGTGKELIARAIHFGSPRAQARFIPLNCSAIPPDLVESTLFGHIKGAFTGASESRKGCFELADGGTLFLDEIGDMPLALQAKLLRTLEDGCVTPVGGNSELRTDVRVLAATNAELQSRISDGQFRSDLYFRLARFTVKVPPLRERREDIPLLAVHFLSMFGREMGYDSPTLTPEAWARLENYHFPGNIRELKNTIEHALIKSRGGAILPEHLYFVESTQISQHNTDSPFTDVAGRGYADAMASFQRWLIEQTLLACEGNRHETARRLRMDRSNLRRIMKRLDIT